MGLLAALTVKVSAILLLALIGALCLRRSSASARRWVLAVGVVSAVAAPALHVFPVLPVRVAPVEPIVFDALQLRPDTAFTEPAVTAVASDDVAGRLVVTIWLAGAVASVGVLLVGLARLRWLRRSSRRVTEGPWHRLCAELAQSCGLRRGVDLLLGPCPGLVATWGWLRPAVMLPASASDWPAERMRVVLLHELAHARRGDWVLQMAAEALRCVWWFNPLAWAVRARLRRESEHAADDLVLARGVPAATCAGHLVELVKEVRKHRRTWLPAPAMARPSHLERRLSAMLNPRTNRRSMTRLARFASLVVLVPASIVVAGLQVGPVSAAPLALPIGGAVEQEQPAGPSSEQIAELVARAAALQEQLQAVLDELQARLGDSGRSAGGSDEPFRIGGGIRPPAKIVNADPIYPPEAREARVQGVVIMEATISRTGEVSDVEVLSSVPLLDEAAVAAVRQWRYEPTLVDGEPVSILMTVTINFRLRDDDGRL